MLISDDVGYYICELLALVFHVQTPPFGKSIKKIFIMWQHDLVNKRGYFSKLMMWSLMHCLGEFFFLLILGYPRDPPVL